MSVAHSSDLKRVSIEKGTRPSGRSGLRLPPLSLVKGGATVATYENELEQEFEQELHELHEGEGETAEAGLEGEGLLGALSGLFGEGEGEEEGELEMQELHEFHEFEGEGELAHEFEGEGEFESSEQFFGKRFRKFLSKAAPILKRVAKVAAPIVARAIGGPVLGNIV